MSYGGKGGSVAGSFVRWCGSTVGTLILIGAVLILTVGGAVTASLYQKGAEVGGQSTGMTLAGIPDFFHNIAVGQKMYGAGDSSTTAKPKAGSGTAKPKQKIECKSVGLATVCKPTT